MLKISITTELIGFSILGKIHIGSGMVLGAILFTDLSLGMGFSMFFLFSLLSWDGFKLFFLLFIFSLFKPFE